MIADEHADNLDAGVNAYRELMRRMGRDEPHHRFVADTQHAWLQGDPVQAANEAEAVLAVFECKGSEARLEAMIENPATSDRVTTILEGARDLPMGSRAELFGVFYTWLHDRAMTTLARLNKHLAGPTRTARSRGV